MKKSHYEKDFLKLEEIVNKLESQQLTLEESLNLFQQGVELYKKCYDQLSSAEDKLTIILEENGVVVEKEEKLNAVEK
ncbi:exodeoxyribonuclease VII small subunit [Tindallia californiensis]|uniref:Exodeoxyribonuclease 7 small subunit n=1 Tax=Tindallia californiensis TaxID=159292 RepID=A0A1H3NK56_9FIRM|nr:exodeoxyribonuclease VII small subunit [Tindallia californiensis]SDY89174.1 Exodeoxyribonuclease VII small subunit [Tindallia californiensis]